MTSISGCTSHSAKQLALGLRSAVDMRSATSVLNRWRVTVLLNRRRASGCSGASLFQTTTAGPRRSPPHRPQTPPTAAPRGLDMLLETPKRAKQWVISLDMKAVLLCYLTVIFGSCIALCLYRGGDMIGDAYVVFIVWALTTIALRL